MLFSLLTRLFELAFLQNISISSEILNYFCTFFEQAKNENKISDFFAKQRVSFWLMIVSDLLSFVGLTALLISNGTQNYAIDGIVGLIFAGIAAPALQAAGIVSKTKYGEKIWADAIFLLSLICIGVCFAGVFINRY